MKNKPDKDAAEFCSDALSIQNTELPWWARISILWMGLFFLFALIWAYISKVDVIVTTHGRIISDPPTIVMKPLERTVVKKICVRSGDSVKKNQVLVEFDPVFNRADKERLSSEVQTYDAQVKRLLSEYYGTAYRISEQASEPELLQMRLFRQRQSLYMERMNYFTQELERLHKSYASLSDNLELQQKKLLTQKEIEKMHKEGFTAKVVSLLNLRQVELSRIQLEADIGDKKNEMNVLESEIRSREAERDAFQQDWAIKVSEELVNAQEMLSASRKEYEKALQKITYVCLRAPEDAVVHDIAPLAYGSAVREAETLVTLIPLGGKLEVEAEIKAEDRGKVHIGDSVRIKVSAFPFQKYGTLKGTVRILSENTFQQNAEDKSQERGIFFRGVIEIEGHEGARDKKMGRLVPGMETVNEIQVGERRILEYLTDPIIKSLDEAVREP